MNRYAIGCVFLLAVGYLGYFCSYRANAQADDTSWNCAQPNGCEVPCTDLNAQLPDHGVVKWRYVSNQTDDVYLECEATSDPQNSWMTCTQEEPNPTTDQICTGYFYYGVQAHNLPSDQICLEANLWAPAA